MNSAVTRLRLSGLEVDVHVSDSFRSRVLDPIADRLRKLAQDPSRREIVGVCGPPGAGKSTLCALLSAESGGKVRYLSMDAYHFQNEQLREMGLDDRKGAPETIDVESFARDVKRLKEEKQVELPDYDRTLHEPIQGRVSIGEECKVILVEGIHLLCRGTSWNSVRDCLNSLIIMDEDVETCKKRLIERKVTNNVPKEMVEAHFAKVDLINCKSFKNDLKWHIFENQRPKVLIRHERIREFRANSLRRLDPGFLRKVLEQKPKKILVIGANPALQKIMRFETSWRKGEVNRASDYSVTLGGKGQNFAKAAMSLRVEPTIVQFLGGSTGKAIESLLNEKGIISKSIWTDEPTRTCTTLIESESTSSTELIEPTARVSQAEVTHFVSLARKELNKNDYAAIALCGTAPPGAEELCADLANLVAQEYPSMIIYMDAYKSVESLLDSVNILKINRRELQSLTDGETVEEKAAKKLFEKSHRLRHLCVTDESNPAFLFSRDLSFRHVRIAVPQIRPDEFVNAIGAGDATGAVLLASLVSTNEVLPSFALGLATGSASCLALEPSSFEIPALQSYFECMRYAEASFWDARA